MCGRAEAAAVLEIGFGRSPAGTLNKFVEERGLGMMGGLGEIKHSVQLPAVLYTSMAAHHLQRLWYYGEDWLGVAFLPH